SWGQSAKLMLGKTPNQIEVLRPLRQGVIADFESTVGMLNVFLQNIKKDFTWIRPKMIISLPCRVTEFEKKAVEEAGRALGARQVRLIQEPVAAAIGAGLPV